MYQLEFDYDKIDKVLWSDFVYKHPHGNIFQTPEMYEVYRNTVKSDPYVIVAMSGNRMVGCLSFVIQKEKEGFLGRLLSRSIIMGGPLVKNDNPEIFDLIVSAYNQMVSSKVIYSQFRNLYDMSSFEEGFKRLEYKKEDHLDIWIDLKKSQEELWKDVHTKRRNEIRRAEKAGIEVRVFNTNSELDQAYSILTEVYKRVRLPLAEKQLFVNAFTELLPKGMLRLMGAYYEGKLIGVMILLSYKATLYDWYAGAYSSSYHLYPNDILPWQTFLMAKNDKYELFDFGGAGKPDVAYGVRDYKMKFGGETVNLGRFEMIHKPCLMALASFAFRFVQRLKVIKL